MRVTPEDVADMLKRTAATRPKALPGAMQGQHIDPRVLQQAKVATEHLTADPNWNVFLQRVQAFIDGERRLLSVASETSAMPNLTGEQILQAHRHMVAMKAKIEAWELVLQLPNAILTAEAPAEKQAPAA